MILINTMQLNKLMLSLVYTIFFFNTPPPPPPNFQMLVSSLMIGHMGIVNHNLYVSGITYCVLLCVCADIFFYTIFKLINFNWILFIFIIDIFFFFLVDKLDIFYILLTTCGFDCYEIFHSSLIVNKKKFMRY